MITSQSPQATCRVHAVAVVLVASMLATIPAEASHWRFAYAAWALRPAAATHVAGVAGLGGHVCGSAGKYLYVGGSAVIGGETQAIGWGAPAGSPAPPVSLSSPVFPGSDEGEVLSASTLDDNSTLCPARFAGYATDPAGHHQPVVWTIDPAAGSFTWEDLPIPPGHTGGEIEFLIPNVTLLRAVSLGFVQDLSGTRHASWWTPTTAPPHDYQCELLPDAGPSYPSEARAAVADAISGLRMIGGGAQNLSGYLMPCVWEQQAGGGFTFVELPLAPGAYLGSLVGADTHPWVSDLDPYFLGYNAIPGGFADFIRPVVYWRTGGDWSEPLVLPPLPGFHDARPTNSVRGTGHAAGGLSIAGYSSNLDAGSETATLWEVEPDRSVTVFDIDGLATNLPPGVRLMTAAFAPVEMPAGVLPFIVGRSTPRSESLTPSIDSDAYVLTFGSSLGVPGPSGPAALELRGPSPNPFATTTVVELSLAGPGRIRAEVMDLAGRRVRELGARLAEAGTHRLAWDGRDGSGREVESGIYFVRVEAGGSSRTVRVARLSN